MNVADLMPASSPSEASFISTANPRRSAQRRYIRKSISAQSWESVPPAPERIVTTASPESYSPLNRRPSSNFASRDSTEPSCESSSAAISGSSAASSASSSRSAASDSSERKVSSRSPARLCAVAVRDARSWSSQKPGRCISASSRSTSAASPSASKVVREQLELVAHLGDARAHGLLGHGLGHRSQVSRARSVGDRAALTLHGAAYDASDEVVVDDPARLHERVCRGRADEAEAAPLELTRHRGRLRRRGGKVGRRARRAFAARAKRPHELRQRPLLLLEPDRGSRILDSPLDLPPVADDALVGQQPLDVALPEPRDLLDLEAGERRPERLALAQDRQPREPGLKPLEA